MEQRRIPRALDRDRPAPAGHRRGHSPRRSRPSDGSDGGRARQVEHNGSVPAPARVRRTDIRPPAARLRAEASLARDPLRARARPGLVHGTASVDLDA